jgi:hypothetical protein
MAAAQSRASELVQAHGIKVVAPSLDDLAVARRDMMASQDKLAKLSKISSEILAAVSADLSGID